MPSCRRDSCGSASVRRSSSRKEMRLHTLDTRHTYTHYAHYAHKPALRERLLRSLACRFRCAVSSRFAGLWLARLSALARVAAQSESARESRALRKRYRARRAPSNERRTHLSRVSASAHRQRRRFVCAPRRHQRHARTPPKAGQS